MNKKFDVIIIGAGVVGSAIARELSRFKLKVAILEKEVDVSFGTSKANSGIIHAGFHSSPESLKGKLVVPGNSAFDQLCQELDFPFKRSGELMIAFNEEELRILQFYYNQGLSNLVPDMELIGKERTFELEPNLNPDVCGALFAPSAGVIGPYEYCFALIENATQNGVKLFIQQEVTKITQEHPKAFSIETSQDDNFKTSYIVNAAGLYADEIAAMVGLNDFKIHARKGEEYLLDRRVQQLVNRVIFPCPTPSSKGMLVIPTVDGPVMVGPTAVELENKIDYSTTQEGLQKVFHHAQKMVPGIRAGDAITSFVGLRAVASGDDFIIGPTDVPGFINVAGIQSPGLTASPAIAKMVRDILIGEGLSLEQDPAFNPVRKRKVKHLRPLLEKQKFNKIEKLVKSDKKYSNLVCRCENVTEAEIIDAIHQGHTTMDGIKFATRTGTGRCQGGFCSTRVMEILNQETGMPIEQITKKGPGSELVKEALFKGNQHPSDHIYHNPAKTEKTSKIKLDALVIGAGPAGLAAALSLKENGVKNIAIVEREASPGGILQQCIHNGFGLHHFNEELTGPEYAERYIKATGKAKIKIWLNTCAVDIINKSSSKKIVMLLSEDNGLIEVETKAIILAMGCRERNRGNINIPGTRPSGIMTAGNAQKLVNLYGYLPGKEIVILGSGDIGLIMARRLTWEGANVKAVIEVQPYPGGLNRNIAQCLDDFDIPLYLSHTVSNIAGSKRIESVEVAPLDASYHTYKEKSFTIPCDTLLLSVGLIPENELSIKAGIELDSVTRGAKVDQNLMTSIPGIFSCGNVLHVHDLVDWVSEEAQYCGKMAAKYIKGKLKEGASKIPVKKGHQVRYVLPGKVQPGKPAILSLRPVAPAQDVVLKIKTDTGEELYRKKHPKIYPSIMERIKLKEIPSDVKTLEVAFEKV